MPRCLPPLFEIQKPIFLKTFTAHSEDTSVKSIKND